MIDSIWIGIKLWLIPQISEHWPKINPGLFVLKFWLFNWFGIVSIFKFIDGIVQEWITSIEVKINCKFILNGIIILLSVSIILKLKLFLYIIYELNLLLKFKYS